MPLSSVRKGLGFGWFCFLVVLTAGIVVSMDYGINSLQNALLYHFLTTLIVSVPIAVLSGVPLILFKRKQWRRGLLATFTLSALLYGSLFFAQTPIPSLAVRDFLLTIPQAVAMLGSWLILITLPPALLLKRA